MYIYNKSMQKPPQIQAEKLIGLKVPMFKTTFTDQAAIMYSLGIGFSQDPLRQHDFKYTNEFHSQFTPFPTLAVTILRGQLVSLLNQNPHVPQFDPNLVLHAEHKLTMVHNRIQIGVQYQNQAELIDCADKGKNAFILSRCNSYLRNQQGQRQLAFINYTLLYFKGLGGFNFKGKGLIQSMMPAPSRKPDFTLQGSTYSGQAFLYRLCADLNPLHIDPQISKALNFDRPIIHGLATYGTVTRVIVQQILCNEPSQLKSIQTRFVGHVYPGQKLEIRVWRESNKLIYEAIVKQRKSKAIVGYIEVRNQAKL